MEVSRANGAAGLRIEDDQVRVTTNRECALRGEPKPARRCRREEVDQPLEGEPPRATPSE
jgi:hypothetical protein